MLSWFTPDYEDPEDGSPVWAPRQGATQREIMVHRYGAKGALAYAAAWLLAAVAIGLMAWVLFGRIGGRPFPR